MKRNELTEDDFINWWLRKYHDTDMDKVIKAHPEWEAEPEKHTRDFYNTYRVTQEQHDEWHAWFIKAFMKEFRVGKKMAERHSGFAYLNVAPSVKQEIKQAT